MKQILDIHCHIYPDSIAKKAAVSTAAFYDYHGALLDGTVTSMLREAKAAGITKSVIHSVATKPHQVLHINRFIAAVAEQYPDQCIPFGTLHPDCEDLDAQIQYLADRHIIGIKLHPDIQSFSLTEKRCIRLIDACQDQFILLLHTGDNRFQFSNPAQLKPLLTMFPRTTFIAAHFGGYTMWQQATAELAGKYDNLFVDCSSSMAFLSAEEIAADINAYGTDRVLFGTDFPMMRPDREIKSFLKLPLSLQQQHRILWDNGAQLLHLK